MAKSAVNKLKAAVRTETGKGASRRARREGKIPAVIYGHGADPQHLELPGKDFAAVLRHSGTNAVLTLDIEGKEQLALTKALDIHPIRRSIQHADLLVVRRGEKVVVEVNVIIEGEAGPDTLVTQDTQTIEIEVDAMSIPEQLTVSVEGAAPGTQFAAGQITLPAGVNLISDPELLVVNVVNAPTAQDLEEEGAGETSEAASGRRSRRRGRRSRGHWRRVRVDGSRRGRTGVPICWSAWAIPETTTREPGTTSGSWWPTCLPAGWARNSRRTSVPAPRSPAAGWPGIRCCWPSRAAT